MFKSRTNHTFTWNELVGALSSMPLDGLTCNSYGQCLLARALQTLYGVGPVAVGFSTGFYLETDEHMHHYRPASDADAARVDRLVLGFLDLYDAVFTEHYGETGPVNSEVPPLTIPVERVTALLAEHLVERAAA